MMINSNFPSDFATCQLISSSLQELVLKPPHCVAVLKKKIRKETAWLSQSNVAWDEGQEDDEQPDKLVHLHDSYSSTEKGKPKRIRPERNRMERAAKGPSSSQLLPGSCSLSSVDKRQSPRHSVGRVESPESWPCWGFTRTPVEAPMAKSQGKVLKLISRH